MFHEDSFQTKRFQKSADLVYIRNRRAIGFRTEILDLLKPDSCFVKIAHHMQDYNLSSASVSNAVMALTPAVISEIVNIFFPIGNNNFPMEKRKHDYDSNFLFLEIERLVSATPDERLFCWYILHDLMFDIVKPASKQFTRVQVYLDPLDCSYDSFVHHLNCFKFAREMSANENLMTWKAKVKLGRDNYNFINDIVNYLRVLHTELLDFIEVNSAVRMLMHDVLLTDAGDFEMTMLYEAEIPRARVDFVVNYHLWAHSQSIDFWAVGGHSFSRVKNVLELIREFFMSNRNDDLFGFSCFVLSPLAEIRNWYSVNEIIMPNSNQPNFIVYRRALQMENENPIMQVMSTRVASGNFRTYTNFKSETVSGLKSIDENKIFDIVSKSNLSILNRSLRATHADINAFSLRLPFAVDSVEARLLAISMCDQVAMVWNADFSGVEYEFVTRNFNLNFLQSIIPDSTSGVNVRTFDISVVFILSTTLPTGRQFPIENPTLGKLTPNNEVVGFTDVGIPFNLATPVVGGEYLKLRVGGGVDRVPASVPPTMDLLLDLGGTRQWNRVMILSNLNRSFLIASLTVERNEIEATYPEVVAAMRLEKLQNALDLLKELRRSSYFRLVYTNILHFNKLNTKFMAEEEALHNLALANCHAALCIANAYQMTDFVSEMFDVLLDGLRTGDGIVMERIRNSFSDVNIQYRVYTIS